MVAKIDTSVLDLGLTNFHNIATRIDILSAEPSVYGDIATYTLGDNVWSAGSAVGAPAAGDVSGRKVTTTAITAGTVTGSGTVAYWSITDGTTLLACGVLSTSQAVYSGNSFTLGAFKIELPDR